MLHVTRQQFAPMGLMSVEMGPSDGIKIFSGAVERPLLMSKEYTAGPIARESIVPNANSVGQIISG